MSRKKDISLMRKTIVAGNWKMNKTPSEAKALIEELKPLVASETSDVVFCVPAIDIPAAIEAAAGSNIAIGAENMYFEESGAYTGEIAPNMLNRSWSKNMLFLDILKEENTLLKQMKLLTRKY